MINLNSRAWRSTISSILLTFEAAVVFFLDVYLIVQNYIADNIEDRHALIGEIIYASFGAAVLLLLAWGFFNNRKFQRAPAILINLIFAGVSTYMYSEGLYLIGSITLFISLCTVIAAISVFPENK